MASTPNLSSNKQYSEGTQQINIRAGELLPDLQARLGTGNTGTLADVLRRDLTRYYYAIESALLKVANTDLFSDAEVSLIVDVQNGTLNEPHTIALIWANVADAVELEDRLAEKHGVDGPLLVRKLRALTPFERTAVADAVERWWQSTHDDQQPELTDEQRHRLVGLIREDRAVDKPED